MGRPEPALDLPLVHRSDVIIVGAGFAGSLLALVLGRQGVGVSVVDLHRVYPSDFRCEKFSSAQLAILEQLGALEHLEGLEPGPRRSLADRGLRYDRMVNAVRTAWPTSVRFFEARALEAAAGPQRQRVELSTGETLDGRLVVLATGRSEKLRKSLGIGRRTIRQRHSICVGFSIAPPSGGFPFQTLVRQGERAGDHVAFASLFPMGGATRVNLFSYHDPRDIWTRRLREDPLAGLCQTFPKLAPVLGDARLVEPAEVRATDLYQSDDCVRPGLVLIGDAFGTSCPATGMGMTRILTDVRQLAQEHLPAWLDTPGMDEVKVAQFYADPIKRAADSLSARKAEIGRACATQTSVRWRLRRGLGRLAQAARQRLALRSAARRLRPETQLA